MAEARRGQGPDLIFVRSFFGTARPNKPNWSPVGVCGLGRCLNSSSVFVFETLALAVFASGRLFIVLIEL